LVFALAGTILLFGFGLFLNLAPVEFGQVAGLYIATLFVVWQIINYVAFRTLPAIPIIVGGFLVIAGGMIITFWKPCEFQFCLACKRILRKRGAQRNHIQIR
jgi:hypothetical protein